MQNNEQVKEAYKIAKDRYAAINVDTEKALLLMNDVKVSLHCWQTDDVSGFEKPNSQLSGGGIQATGNYFGRSRNITEMRADLDKVLSLLPGKQRLNLHAIYGDFGNVFVDRNQIEIKHFASWIEWAKERNMGIDFNATCFSHPKANEGFTLSSKNTDYRKFWIEHVKRCRAIAAEIGKQLGIPCVHNLWIPDGSKDTPVDRYTHRALLKESLDEIFKDKYSESHLKDAIESKLFGIGSESMVVGSHDFYLSYAVQNNKMICLDNGHFHPTEQVGDKISSCLLFLNEILLHVTRGVRWDSDHVVTLNDEIQLIAHEIVRANAIKRVHVGLDFFDACLNRIGAYVIGTRATQQAFLYALLEPTPELKKHEEKGNYFEQLAWLELMKTMPFGAVWDYYCLTNNVPVGAAFIKEISDYENNVLKLR